MAASDLDELDEESDGLETSNKIIKSAFDSESFDSDGIIDARGLKGSATISPCGRDVALASPEGLAIIDLDSPYSAPRRLRSHGMPWLVVDAQWSPFAARDYWVASTASHRCLVWNLNRADDSSAGSVEHSLNGHRRSITDINFSAHHPDMLATCSVDGYVHCWDLRRATTPALTFIDWAAGATQVKYNRQDEHVIASSHNRCVHIWDDRNPSAPMRTIEAHTSKIYGLDWNRTRSTCLVTCSLDKTIKFWDYAVRGGGGGGARTSMSTLSIASMLSDGVDLSGSVMSGGPINDDDVPERVIRTHFPVWRARHTPFSGGLLAMPQNAPGHLYLYDARPSAAALPEDPKAASEPVAVFAGHGHHKVREFLWRTRGGIDNGSDDREFQLVSWGNDSKLRLRRFDSADLDTVGFQRGQAAPKNLSVTRKGAAYKTFRVLEDLGDYEKRNATMSSVRPYSRWLAMAHTTSTATTTGTAAGTTTGTTASTVAGSAPSPPRPLARTASMRDVLSPSVPGGQGRGRFERASWRNRSMRATTGAGRLDTERSSAQLDWMKGVTLTSRKRWASELGGLEESAEEAQRRRMEESMGSLTAATTTTTLSSPVPLSAAGTSASGGADYGGGPETVQEEIVRMTDRLSRVTWEEIDMDNLTLRAALQGPWGVDGQTVYIKVRVAVPATYPQSRAPRFLVESSSLMPDAAEDRMVAELHVIGAEYLKRRRNSLLVSFRYLLGAIDLGGCLAALERPTVASWLEAGGGSGGGSGSGGGGGGSGVGTGGSRFGGSGVSSDDDSDSVSSGSSDSEMDMAAADAAEAAAAMAAGPAPPPRSCGARFTRDGRMICFFLTKAGRASARMLFEPPAPPTSAELAALEQPVFIGFGRVLPAGRSGAGRRAGRRGKLGSSAAESQSARTLSSESEDASSSGSESSDLDSDSAYSSSSASSAMLRRRNGEAQEAQTVRSLIDPWSMSVGFQRRIVRGGGGISGGRAWRRRVASSDGESAGSDLLVRSGTLEADLELPLGPKSTVVVTDVQDWLPSKRALAKEYAVFGDGAEVCEHNAAVAARHGETELAGVWQYAALLLKSDVPLRLAAVHEGGRRRSVLVIGDKGKEQALKGRVKWGLHPLARNFVDDLFRHFERRADVQMLAMLSCVFGESFEEDGVAYAESHLSKPDTPLPMKAPSFSLDYVPTTRGLEPSLGSMAVVYDGSIDPDGSGDDGVAEDKEYDDDNADAVWEAAASVSYSTDNTPPGDSGDSGGGLSSSPRFGLAASRLFRRGNAAVVSAIAASIPQTLTTLLSSSPGTAAAAAAAAAAETAMTMPATVTPPVAPRQTPYAMQPLSQAYKQLLLHSTPARDIPQVGLRRAATSTSTSPRTGGGGKLSSSPQEGLARKRPSPAETIFGNLTAGNLTWAASALFGGVGGGGGGGGGSGGSGGSERPEATVSEDGRRRVNTVTAAASAVAKGAQAQAEAAGTALVAVDMQVRTFNDQLFDDDGWMVASLLGGVRRRRRQYAEYRYAYSELLQVWGEPLARLEVLKFNVLRDDAMRAGTATAAATATTAAKTAVTTASTRRARLLAVRDSGRGLDAVGVCPLCEMQLEPAEYEPAGAPGSTDTTTTTTAARRTTATTATTAAPTTTTTTTTTTTGGAVGYCRRCRRARSQLRCVYCAEPVDALYLPCFGCGCASHPACLRAWHAAGERECPAGDECVCAEEAARGRVESYAALQAALGRVDSYGSAKSKGLIELSRRSAHYAASSASASLLSPYGQPYAHDDHGGRRARLPPSGLQQQLLYRERPPASPRTTPRESVRESPRESPSRDNKRPARRGEPEPSAARFSLSSRLLRGSRRHQGV